MKKFFILLLVCFLGSRSIGQLEFKNSNIGRMLGFVDQNGRSLLKSYDPDIAGSPFIKSDWTPANITLSTGKMVGLLPVKLNIVNNELYFRDSTGTELVALPSIVKKVDCIYSYWRDSIRYVFKSGYPQIDEQNQNFYYQVLAEGKAELLLKEYKYIRVSKDELSGAVSKEFVEGSRMYVYSNNAMQAFQPSKDFILSLMKDKQQAMAAFVESNKTNFKKPSDLVKLFAYYNGQK